MKKILVITLSFIMLFSCEEIENLTEITQKDQNIDKIEEIIENPEYITDGFDFPVGKPNAKKYYNVQKFGENNHLGEDWNGKGGGNTDLGILFILALTDM